MLTSRLARTKQQLSRNPGPTLAAILAAGALSLIAAGLTLTTLTGAALAQETAAAATGETLPQDLEPAAFELRENVREKLYFYQAFTRRDPFASILKGEFERENKLVNVYAADLVGILSGAVDTYGMVEDEEGIGHILSVGDPVQDGRVISIGEKSLVARITNYGQSSNVTLKLQEKQETDSKKSR